MTTATTACPDDDRPVIVAAYRHWRKVRWPDGRVEVTSARKAQELGAVEENTNQLPAPGGGLTDA